MVRLWGKRKKSYGVNTASFHQGGGERSARVEFTGGVIIDAGAAALRVPWRTDLGMKFFTPGKAFR